MKTALTSRRALLTGIAAAAGGTLVASATIASSPSADTVAEDILGVNASAAIVRKATATVNETSLHLSQVEDQVAGLIDALPHTTATYAGRQGPVTISTADGTSFAEVLANSANRHSDYAKAGRRIVNAAAKRKQAAARLMQQHDLSRLLDNVRAAEDALGSAVNALTAYPVKTIDGLLHKLTVMAADDIRVFGDDTHDDGILADLRRITGKEA